MKRLMAAVGVALLFGLGGALSSLLFDGNNYLVRSSVTLPVPTFFLVPLPFAFLFTLLFLRTNREILAAPLFVVAWVAAFLSAVTSLKVVKEYLVLWCVGGLVGGLGVTLAATLYRRHLLTVRYLAGGAAIGCAASLPFAILSYWRDSHGGDPCATAGLQYPFGIWQAAVAVYLYLCTRTEKNARPEKPQEGHPL